jgi:hypothetical protein
VLGVSEWDGKGRATNYPCGFLLVTHTGGTYYVSVASQQERDEWILHFRVGLECVFANQEVSPFKPSKIIQNRPPSLGNHTCPKSQHTLTSYSPQCRSCGRGFYSNEFLQESTVLLQLGSEEAEKVCSECKLAQMCIFWLKMMNYVHTLDLHEHTQTVLKDVIKFKASFKLRRRISQRLDMAAELYEGGSINADEFEELRAVDHAYRREMTYEECSRLQVAIETFGEDIQTIVNIFMDSNITTKGGRNACFKMVIRILELADSAPDLIDFYFPQLYQIHLQQSLKLSPVSELIKLDAIQQMLLVLSQKYPSFGLKLTWNLLSSVGDYNEKKISQLQYAACTCLLLQLEMCISGVISSIADIPVCRILERVLRPTSHQQQEIGYEISALFLIRRKLQEAYDEDDSDRVDRNMKVYGPNNVIHNTNINSLSILKQKKDKDVPIFPGSNRDCSSIELLYSLGVGQAKSDREFRSDSRKVSSSRKKKSNRGEDKEKESEAGSSEDEQEIPFTGNSLIHVWDGYSEQLDFMDRLNDLVESLRFIDRPLRTETLRKQLAKWNNAHKHPVVAGMNSISKDNGGALSKDRIVHDKVDELNDNIMENPMLGWDPTIIAGEPQYRITRIIVEECRVFRTKARAPSLVVCEVMRDDLYSKYFYSHNLQEDVLIENVFSDSPKTPKPNKIMSPDRNNSATTTPRITSEKKENRKSFSGETKAVMTRAPHHSVVRTRGRAEPTPKDNEASPVPTPESEQSAHDKKEAEEKERIEGYINSIHISSEELTGMQSKIHEKLAQESLSHRHGVDDEIENKELMIAGLALDDSSKTNDPNNGNSSSYYNNSSTPESSPSKSHPAGMEKRVSSGSGPGWQLPRWKTSTFLASNRLSSSTQGILKSSQVSYPNVDTKSKHHLDHVNLDHLKSVMHNQGTNSKINAIKNSSSSGNLQMVTTTKESVSSIPPPRSASSSALNSKKRNQSVSSVSDNYSPRGNNQETFDIESVSSKSEDTVSNINSPSSKDGVPHQQVVISSAQRLLIDGAISQKEYDQLLQSDQHYREEAARDEAFIAKHRVEHVFGETFQSKKERILGDKLDHFHHSQKDQEQQQQETSTGLQPVIDENDDAYAKIDDAEYWPAYDLRAFIVKTNDDLRQEICCVQLMQIFKEIFDHFGLSNMLFLKPYRILCTGYNTGIVEVLADSISLDGLKKTPGFTTLINYFNKTYNTSAERLLLAKYNFMASLAAYSLFSYILLIKDRHNGNLLIDSEGHILHIDFGFLLSIAPGGSFSMETAPFKLTEEMVELLGGLDSPLFGEFVTAFTKGFIALQANCENILSAINMLSINSTFPCFQNKPVPQILEKLKARFRSELSVKDAVKHCLDLITNSYGHYGTRQYDTFQYYTNGILP